MHHRSEIREGQNLTDSSLQEEGHREVSPQDEENCLLLPCLTSEARGTVRISMLVELHHGEPLGATGVESYAGEGELRAVPIFITASSKHDADDEWRPLI